jgi:hypothetical protein
MDHLLVAITNLVMGMMGLEEYLEIKSFHGLVYTCKKIETSYG